MSPPTLLLVDDARSITDPLTILLEAEGFRVTVASALASALEEPPHDALIADFRLPDGTGPELVGRLAQRGTCPPWILLTALDPGEVRLPAGTPRPIRILQKPAPLRTLRVALQEAFGHLHATAA